MPGFSLFVPFKQLPPGYAGTLGPPPDPPVTPKPAATLALLREGREGLEVLLLKRGNRTSFIPGAFVFPGGRVDADDTSPGVHAFLKGLSSAEADARLGITQGETPGPAFWATAIRETFEETGVLLEECVGGSRSVPMGEEEGYSRWREKLHSGEASFEAILGKMGASLGGGRVAYIGHWVTPVQERYRYDTRFFAAEASVACPVFVDGVEMVESVWVTPSAALAGNREGNFPMVFPTLVTLRSLEPFGTPAEALETLGKRKVPRRLPRVEETGDGVRMIVDAWSQPYPVSQEDR